MTASAPATNTATQSAVHAARFATFDIRAPFALPHLAPPTGVGTPLDVSIGVVPERMTGDAFRRPGYEVADRQALFAVPGLPRFLMESPDRIIVAENGREPELLPLLLLGWPLACVLMRRGLLPLHAAAVCSEGSAVVLAGASGAGKSSLAALLEERGFTPMADDLVAIDVDANDRPRVWPGATAFKLWPDTLRAMGRDPDAFERCRPTVERRFVPFRERRQAPVPLRSIYVLDTVAGQPLRARSVLEAIPLIAGATLAVSAASPLGAAASHLRLCAAAARAATVVRLPRPAGRAGLAHLADRLAAELRRDV